MQTIKKHMQNQPDLFSGEHLRDLGINQAMDSSNQKEEKWTDKAFEFLRSYIESNSEFMAEDVRNASKGTINEPPSSRAWGGILVRAVKAGLIKRKGFKNVKNEKAHCTPATLWEVCR